MLTTYAAILKTLVEPVENQLNDSVVALRLFEKSRVQWSNNTASIPLRMSGNASPADGWLAEGDTLPTAGTDTFLAYTFHPRYIYGTFGFTRQDIASTRDNAGAAIEVLSDSMDRMIVAIEKQANQALFSGGRVIGFLSQHKVEGGAANWVFDGDLARVNTWVTRLAANADTLTVRLVRMDTYATISDEEIDSVNIPAGTIHLVGACNTSAVAAGYAIAVVALDVTDVAAARCLPLGGGATAADSRQLSGIFSNLAEPIVHGVDRTTATATGVALQSGIFTMSTALEHDREDLSMNRVNDCFDFIFNSGDTSPDLCYCNTVIRSQYAASFQQTQNFVKSVQDKPGKADAGFTGFSVNGIPLDVDANCPKGMLLLLSKDSWRVAEQKPLAIEDLDGRKYREVGRTDTYEGYASWFAQFYCKRPNQNAILTGINYAGASVAP